MITQEMIDAAIKRMKAADIARQRAADRDSPRRQHIDTFNKDLRHISSLAQKYEKAREEVVRLKIQFREQNKENPHLSKFIPCKAVRFNQDGSVSIRK